MHAAHPIADLPQADQEFLAAIVEARGNLPGLAQKNNLRLLDLFAWLQRSDIRAALASIQRSARHIARIRQAFAQQTAIDALEAAAVSARTSTEACRAGIALAGACRTDRRTRPAPLPRPARHPNRRGTKEPRFEQANSEEPTFEQPTFDEPSPEEPARALAAPVHAIHDASGSISPELPAADPADVSESIPSPQAAAESAPLTSESPAASDTQAAAPDDPESIVRHIASILAAANPAELEARLPSLACFLAEDAQVTSARPGDPLTDEVSPLTFPDSQFSVPMDGPAPAPNAPGHPLRPRIHTLHHNGVAAHLLLAIPDTNSADATPRLFSLNFTRQGADPWRISRLHHLNPDPNPDPDPEPPQGPGPPPDPSRCLAAPSLRLSVSSPDGPFLPPRLHFPPHRSPSRSDRVLPLD
jgi:hypothetical protein